MRRICFLIFLFPFLCIGANSKQTSKYAALVIECSCANGTPELLEGLYDRGIHSTFLLQGSSLAKSPEILERILADGHEVGCRGYSGENMTLMSRRAMAGEIMEFQSLLPQGYPLKLFCPPGGCSDGVRQVAEARKLGILSWSRDLTDPADTIQDGDLILIRDSSPILTEEALAYVDRLIELGFRPITVTELAKLRNIKIHPGKIYSSFPLPEEENPA
jgi:peptidoglycan/xylan/chitin deacetylase (PgdA/CDA1 family)